MNDRIEPADAALALSEIERRREQVIRRTVIPGWFWWAQAVLTVGLTACIEFGTGAVPWIGVGVFTVGSAVINLPVSRAARAAPVNRALAVGGKNRRVVIALVVGIAALLGVVLGTAFGLHAAGVPASGTIASVVASLLFAIGGPMLVRYEAAILVRGSRSRR